MLDAWRSVRALKIEKLEKLVKTLNWLQYNTTKKKAKMAMAFWNFNNIIMCTEITSQKQTLLYPSN